jgi:hypothetical protein
MTRKVALLWIASVTIGAGSVVLLPRCEARAKAAQAQTAPASATRAMGTVKSIAGNAITLAADAGTETHVVVAEGARILRMEPGQKSLSGATPIQFQEVQAGDRMLVKGTSSEDGKSIIASVVVVMKKTDIAEKQAREREDWQKRGVGGPVTAIDPETGTITVSTSAPGGSKSVAVHTTKNTIVRRYAPDSVKFDDAKLAKFDEIKTGDQLRARGDRSADGSELTAEEIVAGTFRNIAGTVVSTDAVGNSFTVTDLATKKPVVVKVTADSQLRKLPPMIALGLAMRLKGGEAAQNGNGHAPATVNSPASPNRNGGGPGNGNGNGRGDFNQMLSRLPAVTVGELQKGDAVMIVTTQGTASEVTAITLLSGVEPILTASPKGNGSMILSPWNVGGGGEGGGEGPVQ